MFATRRRARVRPASSGHVRPHGRRPAPPWLALGLLALLLPLHAARAAQDEAAPGYRPAYAQCLDAVAKGGDRSACVAQEFDAQDARLNAAYRQLAGSLDPAGRQALRAEERQWIAARDQACGQGAVKNECSLERTARRADELARRIGGAPADAGGAFEGNWAYRSRCGSGHYVQLSVERVAGGKASGTWSDGTDVGGDSGAFEGSLRDGKLYVRFCTEESKKGLPACPQYGAEDTAYFARRGGALTWYDSAGSGAGRTFQPYVALQRARPGEKVPLDTHCPANPD